jgi:sigma-54 specific flagellar transcriptional regulator A
MEKIQNTSVRFSLDALKILCQSKWQGNIRELSNLIERMAIINPYALIEAKDLPEKYFTGKTEVNLPEEVERGISMSMMYGMQEVADNTDLVLTEDGINLKDHLRDVEIDLINQALHLTEGVVAQASKVLNLGRTTLVEKMKKYGIVWKAN